MFNPTPEMIEALVASRRMKPTVIEETLIEGQNWLNGWRVKEQRPN